MFLDLDKDRGVLTPWPVLKASRELPTCPGLGAREVFLCCLLSPCSGLFCPFCLCDGEGGWVGSGGVGSCRPPDCSVASHCGELLSVSLGLPSAPERTFSLLFAALLSWVTLFGLLPPNISFCPVLSASEVSGPRSCSQGS